MRRWRARSELLRDHSLGTRVMGISVSSENVYRPRAISATARASDGGTCQMGMWVRRGLVHACRTHCPRPTPPSDARRTSHHRIEIDMHDAVAPGALPDSRSLCAAPAGALSLTASARPAT